MAGAALGLSSPAPASPAPGAAHVSCSLRRRAAGIPRGAKGAQDARGASNDGGGKKLQERFPIAHGIPQRTRRPSFVPAEGGLVDVDLEWRVARLRPGDHLCLIYHSAAEQTAALVSFFKAGFAAGERCLFVGHGTSARRLERSLDSAGVAVDAERD